MSNEIVININEANKAQKYKDNNELFQIEAFEKVTTILNTHNGSSSDNEDISDCRFHDTIFIDGDRGVGKTAFMLNIEKYFNDNSESKKFIFLNPIDPTLLEHTEQFLSVVLAKVVEYVNNEIKGCLSLEDTKLEEYYKSLEELSKSLKAISSLAKERDEGIEEIASYASSLNLEQNAHNFFKTVSKMFDNTNGIVVLIDDVDMAFDRGFDVLEVVRKYLASPFIIPIVAGDMNLYREIVETKFKEKIEFSKDIQYLNTIYKESQQLKNSSEYKEKKELVDNLVEQYLHKVFPNEYHIQLKDIFTILKENYVAVRFDKNFYVSYSDVKNFEIRHLNMGINQVDFTFQVFTNNTRDLVQYLYSKKNIYKEVLKKYSTEKYEKEKCKYISYSIDKTKKFDSDIFDNDKKLYSESYLKTSEFYSFSSDRKKKELSKLTKNDYNSFIDSIYSIYSAFSSEYFNSIEKLKLDNAKDKYSIQYKSLEEYNENVKNNVSKYIVDLFVFNDYYSNHQRRNYIYAGKFIESIIFSLFKNKLIDINESIINQVHTIINIDDIFKDNKLNEIYDDIKTIISEIVADSDNSLESKFKKISNGIPFGSDISNKKDRYKEENPIEKDGQDSENDVVLKYNLKDFTKEIIIWQNIFLKDIKLNSLSLYEIVYKFFRNLEKLKQLDLKNEKPIDFIRRIVLIFINAVAYFEIDKKEVASVNFCMGKNFKLDDILSKSAASQKNIQPMLREKFSLTRALFFHPIISFLLSDELLEDTKLNDLIFINSTNQNNTNKSKNHNNEIEKKLNKKYQAVFVMKGENIELKPGKNVEDIKTYLNNMCDYYLSLEGDDEIYMFNQLNKDKIKYYKAYTFIKDDYTDKLAEEIKKYEKCFNINAQK